jgi:hypothetical protein
VVQELFFPAWGGAQYAQRGVDDDRACIVAVARQVHQMAFLRFVLLQIPERGHIGRTETVVHRKLDHKILGEIHGIVPAAAPFGEVFPVDPGKLGFALEQPLLGDRDKNEAIDHPIEKRQIGYQVNLAHQVVRVEAGIFCTVDQEAEECFEV